MVYFLLLVQFTMTMCILPGASPDCVDNDGNTPLMVAATEGFDNVVKSLVEHDCNPDIKNSFGFMPIHYLAMKNHWRGELWALKVVKNG